MKREIETEIPASRRHDLGTRAKIEPTKKCGDDFERITVKEGEVKKMGQ
jgi:hypothetical protein